MTRSLRNLPEFKRLLNFSRIKHRNNCTTLAVPCKPKIEPDEAKHRRYPITPLPEVKRFSYDCLTAVGTCCRHAYAVSEHITSADYRGIFSQGLHRLEMYITEIQSKCCDPNIEPKIVSETKGTAIVDAQNGLGIIAGNFGMDLALKKAKTTGIGIVVVKNSNTCGVLGLYALKALSSKCIGLAFSNTPKAMTVTRSNQNGLGTNPLAFGAPGSNNEKAIVDQTMSVRSMGCVEMSIRKGKTKLPANWAVRTDGEPETDPIKVFKERGLLPLGTNETNFSYKGYGMALMGEILCSCLSDSMGGPNVDKKNVEHCFIALSLQMFEPGFEERLSNLTDNLRHIKPGNAKFPVISPGDREADFMKMVDLYGGVHYTKLIHISTKRLAKNLCVEPIRSIC